MSHEVDILNRRKEFYTALPWPGKESQSDLRRSIDRLVVDILDIMVFESSVRQFSY